MSSLSIKVYLSKEENELRVSTGWGLLEMFGMKDRVTEKIAGQNRLCKLYHWYFKTLLHVCCLENFCHKLYFSVKERTNHFRSYVSSHRPTYVD